MANPHPSRGRAALTLVLLAATLAAIGTWAYLRRTGPDGAGGGDVQLPADFGAAVPASDLSRLADAARGDALNSMNLALDLGTRDRVPRFAIGDRVRVTARAGEPSRCVVFHRNARGAFRLFHPERGESFAISPSQRWDSGDLRVTEPDGAESFLLVCRSEGASSFDLKSVLERPRDEWRRSFSAIRADYEVKR